MAIGSLFSGFWIYCKLEVYSKSKIESELMRSVLKTHWRYGRWASGSSILSWIPGNVFVFLLPIWSGIEASAAYKAVLNLLLPMMHMNTALSAPLLPVLVLKRETPSFGRLVISVSALLLTASIIYWLLLGFFGNSIIQFLYKGHYSEYVGLLWFAGLILIMDTIITISRSALQALELPNKVFLSNVASSGVILTIGVLFVIFWGVRGAMLGWLTSLIVTGTIMVKILAPYVKPSDMKTDHLNGEKFP
jgi:O-antigen/teichoic acid export membrane protein